ncbi:hypothetical protein [Mesorhizobium sp. A623]
MEEFIVEAERIRVSDFEMQFVEDEKSFEMGWLLCTVEILDDDGDVDRYFTAKSAVEFGDYGGSLYKTHLNAGFEDKSLAPVIEEAMEKYLEHPAVKQELADVYAEGLRLADEEDENDGSLPQAPRRNPKCLIYHETKCSGGNRSRLGISPPHSAT